MFQNHESFDSVRSIISNGSDATFEVKKTCPCDKANCKLSYLEHFKDSMVFVYSATIKVVVGCPSMDFSTFPLDTQVCGFYMKDVRQDPSLAWLPALMDETNLGNLTNSQFSIGLQAGMQEGYTGFELVMMRKTGVFIYTYFLPCSLMVVTSWFSFSVQADAIPGRLGLLLTLLLMMINLTNSAAQMIPGSDHLCPLIIWIWLSIAFVAFALVEYFVILTILKFGKPKVPSLKFFFRKV